MEQLRIAVILGSTRPGRNGKAVADWVIDQATGRPASYELLDLVDYPLPHFDEVKRPMLGEYANAHTKEWAAVVAQYDVHLCHAGVQPLDLRGAQERHRLPA